MFNKKKTKVFLSGLSLGAVLTLAVVAFSAWVVLRDGVTVYIKSEDIAAEIGVQVRSYVERDLPRMIDGAKAEVPYIVENGMDGQITSRRMEIAGFIFAIPDEFFNQLDRYLKDNVTETVYQLLDEIDTTMLAGEIGTMTTSLVEEQMKNNLHGSIINVNIKGPVNFPVKIHLKD